MCGNFVAKLLICARKSLICGVRISNCGNRSGIGRRCTLGPSIEPSTLKPRSSNFAARIANSKINSSVERASLLRPGTVRIVSKAKRIRPLPCLESEASGRTGLVHNGGTTATCPWSKISVSCPKTSVRARSAARHSRPATPRIPNRSRSKFAPIAGGSAADVTSGRAPAGTVLERSQLPGAQLIPKGVLGVSVWVEILLDKFASHRPTERLLAQWRLLGLDVAAGTVAGGLERLEPLFQPLYDALLKRNASAAFAQADETRWMVFVTQEGKSGYRWWLWVFLGEDTVVFRLDPTRSHDVPEGHFPADARVVLMVDRYSAYKAMSQVKLGNAVLVFCWAHVRRDFVKVGKGWPEHKEWALAWLRRIRALYHHDRRRRNAKPGSTEFAMADIELRKTAAAMQSQAAAELADPKLPTPSRNVLASLQEHWSGLTRFLDDPRIPLDNNASERRVRGPALGRKNYYGSGSLWSGRLAAMLFSLFATLSMAKINIRTWLTWYLEVCAQNGGKVPTDIDQFLPWKMSAGKRRELAIDPMDSS